MQAVSALAIVSALIIAVLIDWWARHLPGGQFIMRCRSTAWTQSYVAKITNMLTERGYKQSYLVALALLVPLCIAYFLLLVVFLVTLGKTGGLLFVTLVLLYCLGNKPEASSDSEFVAAHESSFGVMFWFVILGPLGALLYWFLAICKQNEKDTISSDQSMFSSVIWLHAVASWIPVRITGFIYALVGNFTAGFNTWVKCISNPAMPGSEFLNACGEASVDARVTEDAQNLVERAFIAWVILSVLILVVK